MTTDPSSEPEAKQEQPGAGAAPPHTAPPLEEQLPPAAAHSTPVRKEQNGEREAGGVPQGKPDQQVAEDDLTSHRSSSSKLSRSPVKVPKKPKNMQCKVTLLDGSDYTCVVEKRDKGQVLLDKVCEHLNLLERDYFGITFRDAENQKNWLDPSKDMKKQIRGVAWNFSFNVKFYPPDPAQLSEDITRYYLCLQLRDDVLSGRLPCSFATHTVLGSYTVQSELGDFDPDEYGTDYVSEFRFAPHQTKELEEKVMDLHKNYKGMTPADAEMHFLENVKKLSMYGVDLHHAKDSEGVEIMLGVCSSGLLIYRDRLRINRFAWPKVLKISYKRNNFYIKIRPGEFEQFESTIGFKLPNHRAAKRLWKVCVEHHTFFRLVSPETPPKKFLTLGSKFRYSGRTQVQTRRASSQIVRPAPYFERSTSKRYTMSRSLDGEMGTALYGAAKGIAMSDLITTVTPEKKVEENKAEEGVVLVENVVVVEEEDETTKATEVSQPSPPTPVRQDTRTDFTDTAIDGELTATEVCKIIEVEKTPEELLKHQTNISELKRSFLEGGADKSGLTEWEKRLSSSPLRSPRLDEAPMIEPLVPEDVSMSTDLSTQLPDVSESAVEVCDEPGGSAHVSDQSESDTDSDEATSDSASVASAKFDGPCSPTDAGRPLSPSDSESGGESFSLSTDDEAGSGDQSPNMSPCSPVRLTEQRGVAEGHSEEIELHTPGLEVTPSLERDKNLQKLNFLFFAALQLSSLLQTEVVTFGGALSDEAERLAREMPVIHTEMKTITYEALQVQTTEPGILMSAQTITSETTSTTTTTHITKTVKGGISETRIEKRIVISGDADIDHDEALAQAIKEAKEQHPDMSVTKVVVHKETEITPEEGEE
uniref:Erythrocyte membrane protein band 4.1-like 3a n=1 Tax=Astyanax mexicanus TaxID=7994 RepID=A0A8B9K7W9_ASTMX